MPFRLPKLSRRTKLTVLCSTAVVFLIALITLVTGRVEGTEFAPTHFERRSFVFWEIPLIRLQVTPIERSPVSLSVTNFLRSKNALSIPKNAAETWHLVSIKRGLSDTIFADAEILTAYIDLNEGSTSFWEKWSRDHSDASIVLWPVVQKLAQRELYLILPELFELAQKYPTGSDLQKAIDAWLPEAYARLAEDLREAEQLRLSIEVLQDGLADYPDAPVLLEQMRRSQQQT